MHRLSHLLDDRWVAHSHAQVFTISDRIVAGVPSGDPNLLKHLMACMEPPYFLVTAFDWSYSPLRPEDEQ